MRTWTVDSDATTGRYTHSLREGGHALLAPIAVSVFQDLRVSASIYDGRLWWSVFAHSNLTRFEAMHHRDGARWSYNDRMCGEVLRSKRPVRGNHAGVCDAFVPISIAGEIVGIFVVGPFALERSSAAEIRERWQNLTGSNADLAEPEFSSYLETTLSTLVLDGEQAARFERMLECLARLMGSEGKADELTNEIHVLRLELEKTRFAERTWSAVADMLNEGSFRGHYSAAVHHDLANLGLTHAPDQVLVALSVDQRLGSDPVDRAIRRDALQRAMVELARAAGNVVAGRVGDSGIVFLSADRGGVAKRKRRLDALIQAASRLARDRLGLLLHFGTTDAPESLPLMARYQAALAAAESAQARNLPSATVPSAPSVTRDRLRSLRAELSEIVEVRPDLVPARFDQYLEAVAARTGYLPEPARVELELCVERIAEVLLRSGVLDSKGFSGMRASLDRVLAVSRSTHELFAAYRRAVLDLAEAVRKPSAARQERRLRTALEYIQQNFGESLSLKKAAKISGFAPTYFSELFTQFHGKSFEAYVFSLRLERAKQLLSGSDLSATRVAELSGFRSPQYLCRVFKKTLQQTPLEFRYATRTWEKPQTLPPGRTPRTKKNRTKDKARKRRSP